MSGTKSDLTTKRFAGAQGFRTFKVSDESQNNQDTYPQDMPQTQNLDNLDPDTINAMNAHLASKGFPPISFNQPQENKQQPYQLQEYEEKVKEARRAKVEGEKLSDGAKKRIELLCGMYKGTKEVEIGGQTFVLQTLKSKEIKEAMMTAATFAGSIELPFETRKQFLSRSLIQVGGHDIELFLSDDSLEARLELVENLPEVLVERLFREYDMLDRETKEKFGIKSVAEVQEVAADIKK